MAAINRTRLNMLKVVALRVVRLDAAGNPVVGASSLYVTDTPITFGYTEVRPDRESHNETNGNGDTCLAYQGPPRGATSVDLRADLCALDAQLMELLCGGTIITRVVGADTETIGYLPATDDTVNENGVAIETWSVAWNTRQRALLSGSPAYWRHAFPKTTWQPGEVGLLNGPTTMPLTGVGEPNSEWGTGITTDAFPVAIDEEPYAWALDDAVPAAAVGYQAIA